MSAPSTSWTLIPAVGYVAPTPGGGTFVHGVDFLLDADGDLVVGSDVTLTTGPAAVAQGIRRRLQMFKGEWFLDLDAGVPYYQDLLGQRFNLARARDAFRKAIEAAPGVDELVALEITFDASTRTMRVDWKVHTTFGIIADLLEV